MVEVLMIDIGGSFPLSGAQSKLLIGGISFTVNHTWQRLR